MSNIYFRNRKNGDIVIHTTESVCREYLHQQKIIKRLSRKIQKRNNEIKHLDNIVTALRDCYHHRTKCHVELQERINKALEYIDIQFDNNGTISKELKEILKGGSNDNNI